jgi:hypothetical protein
MTTKTLSREKILDYLMPEGSVWQYDNKQLAFKIRRQYTQEFKEKLESGHFDADEPAFDVDELINKLNEMLEGKPADEVEKGYDTAASEILKFIKSKSPVKEALKLCKTCEAHSKLKAVPLFKCITCGKDNPCSHDCFYCKRAAEFGYKIKDCGICSPKCWVCKKEWSYNIEPCPKCQTSWIEEFVITLGTDCYYAVICDCNHDNKPRKLFETKAEAHADWGQHL